MLKKFIIFVFSFSLLIALNCNNNDIVIGYEKSEASDGIVIDGKDIEYLEDNSDLGPDALGSVDGIEGFSEEIFEEISDEDIALVDEDSSHWKDGLRIALKTALKRIKATSRYANDVYSEHRQKIIDGVCASTLVLCAVLLYRDYYR